MKVSVVIHQTANGAAMIICTAMNAVGSGRLICIDPAPQVAPDHLARMSHRVSLISAASPGAVAWAHELLGSPFDFVFVDGDHTYNGVLRDIEAVSPFLHEGGYVLFHNVHYFEVRDAIDEARKYLPFIDCELLSLDTRRTEYVHLESRPCGVVCGSYGSPLRHRGEPSGTIIPCHARPNQVRRTYETGGTAVGFLVGRVGR